MPIDYIPYQHLFSLPVYYFSGGGGGGGRSRGIVFVIIFKLMVYLHMERVMTMGEFALGLARLKQTFFNRPSFFTSKKKERF